ncbi:MAG: hypothetical protein J5719_02870, partial [Bacteroidales bacterium]|nr:hypothetical protein [Bacteroidales bacterium]
MSKLKSCLLAIIVLMSQVLWAQQTSLELVRQENNKWTYRYTSGKLTAKEIKDAAGTFSQIVIPQHKLSADIGCPQLPLWIGLVDIPICEDVRVEVNRVDYATSTLADLDMTHPLWPAQPSLSKEEEPILLVIDRDLYATDAFYGLQPVTVELRGVMRSANLAALSVSPIRYNPVSGELQIIKEMEFSLTFVGPDYERSAQLKRVHDNALFASQFDRTLAPSPMRTKGVVYPSPIKYLIVADPMFKDELQRFVAWKKRKGFVVEEAYTDDPAVGTTTTSIAQYIKAQYDMATEANPAPTYVLLVGDVQQIPAFSGQTGAHPTDLYYCEWTGDYLPDCYYGRFSAQTVEQLIPQIDKTLAYEQCALADLNYLDNAVMVAGTDAVHASTHADGQVNYLDSQYINENNGYVRVQKYLHDTDAKSEEIRAAIGQGAGFVNYTAHCGSYGWRDPRFDTTHIAALDNYGRYGFVLANCCQSGRYSVSACFAEAMMRANNKGAVSYIGASADTYWDEDYNWAVGFRAEISATPKYDGLYLGAVDRMFHTHGEPFSSWSLSNGAVVAGGNLAVEQSASTRQKLYWEIYHLFGDPSLSAWLTQPVEMPLESIDTLSSGATFLNVSTAPHAMVSLTHNLEWVATAMADANGRAQLRFPMLTVPGDYELTASAQHYKTAFKTITLPPYDSLHVLVTDLQLADGCVPAISQSVNWHVTVSNVGKLPADSIRLEICSNLPNISLIDSVVWLDHLAVGDTLLQSAFSAILPDSLDEGHIAQFDVLASYAQKCDTTRFFLPIAAPKWRMEDYWMEELEGDGDGHIDAGEVIRLSVVMHNVGHVVVDSAIAQLSADVTQVALLQSVDTLSDESHSGYFLAEYIFRVDESVAAYSIIPLYQDFSSGHNHAYDTIYLMTDCAVEDFETGDFSQFSWKQNAYPWIVTDSCSFAGTFSARSARSLGHGQISSFYIVLNVLHDDSITYYRKVSSESGYDFFRFRVDALEMDQASGETPWERVSIPVSKGRRSLTFL